MKFYSKTIVGCVEARSIMGRDFFYRIGDHAEGYFLGIAVYHRIGDICSLFGIKWVRNAKTPHRSQTEMGQ